MDKQKILKTPSDTRQELHRVITADLVNAVCRRHKIENRRFRDDLALEMNAHIANIFNKLADSRQQDEIAKNLAIEK